MGFQFSLLCDLLASLDENRTVKATTAARKDRPDSRTIAQWFANNGRRIHCAETDRLALLSCMFPEKRIDRVYWLQATSLARVIGRCLGLGSSRLSELNRWQKAGGPDLGQCVEDVMRQAENYVPPDREVTVEELDQAMGLIASRCRFSGPEVRRQRTAVDVDTCLSPLYRRLSSRDAKWFTRMILKSYSPVMLPPKYTLERFHFLLPHLLQFQDTFAGALNMLISEPMNHFPAHPDPKLATTLCSIALDHLKPQIGIKIGRPEYSKARSIKHCHQMAKGRRISIERKYDGEYCQIHVDLTNNKRAVQIFSKSGKDSTEDRDGIIPILEESLSMRTARCKFTHRCILEGELLVWSDKHGDVAGFHKLRKFLSRSGSYIGVDQDSPYVKCHTRPKQFTDSARPQPYEHLMIMFFDVLLLDDNVCLKRPHRERRLLLQDIVQPVHGRAAIADQDILDFNRLDSQDRLAASFARAIAQRWEGHILKACDEPYFPFYTAGVEASFGRWIKLKKDYIPGLGDTVDLALIGAVYNAQEATVLSPVKKLRWTHFLIGCLVNKDVAVQGEDTPHFRVVDVINHHCMHRRFMQILNQFGEFYACDPDDFRGFRVDYGNGSLPKASALFKKPFVVEMMGSGFEKPSGARYYTLRFPRILKIHTDRTYEDAASFSELQILADEARSVPLEDLSQEREHWRKRLKVGSGCNDYIVQRSKSPSSQSSGSVSATESESGDSDDEQARRPLGIGDLNHQASGRMPPMNDDKGSPALFVDETVISLDPGSPKNNVLTENENLSSRQHSGHKGTKRPMLRRKSVETTPQVTATELKPPRTQPTSLVKVHSTRIQPISASAGEREEPNVSRSAVKGRDLRSPLTTIPVYMPRSLSSFDATGKDESNSGLCGFLQSISSAQSRSSLRQSNPHAASQGKALGIVLVNPCETPLGHEVHRISKAIAQLHAIPSATHRGQVFFLDSLVLEQNIHPEDLQYCLQDTWSDLGRQYYYASLQWGAHDSLGPGESRDKLYRETHGPQGPPSALAVSFDSKEILALGEYLSVNPPVHARDK